MSSWFVISFAGNHFPCHYVVRPCTGNRDITVPVGYLLMELRTLVKINLPKHEAVEATSQILVRFGVPRGLLFGLDLISATMVLDPD